MNIFFLDTELENCAKYHVDKHVVKMRLELAQIACTVHHLNGTPKDYIPYKPTHIHHPSVVWAGQDLANYCYVVSLGLQLCEELVYRFKTKDQKVKPVLEWLSNNFPDIPYNGQTKPILAMGEEFKIHPVNNFSDAVINYRHYYNQGKTHLFKWTNREKPEFIKQ
jgi:hypothetical protein